MKILNKKSEKITKYGKNGGENLPFFVKSEIY